MFTNTHARAMGHTVHVPWDAGYTHVRAMVYTQPARTMGCRLHSHTPRCDAPWDTHIRYVPWDAGYTHVRAMVFTHPVRTMGCQQTHVRAMVYAFTVRTMGCRRGTPLRTGQKSPSIDGSALARVLRSTTMIWSADVSACRRVFGAGEILDFFGGISGSRDLFPNQSTCPDQNTYSGLSDITSPPGALP